MTKLDHFIDWPGKLGAGRRTFRRPALRPDAKRRDGPAGACRRQLSCRKYAVGAGDRNRSLWRSIQGARRCGSRGAVRCAAQRRDWRTHRWPGIRPSTIADGETLKLGMAQGGAFSYLAIEGGFQGEPMFGSFSVNARVGLGSPFPRPLQAGDELGVAAASAAPERRIDLPAAPTGPIRVALGPQNDEFSDDAINLFLDSEWKISATSDRMGYRLEGPVIKHLHGHNIVSDGTVNGSIQVPGNGQPIVLMSDRGTSGGYPKIATVIIGRFRTVCARSRPELLSGSRPSAWKRRKPRRANLPSCCAPCPIGSARSRALISISKRCKMPTSPALPSARVDARTWQVADVQRGNKFKDQPTNGQQHENGRPEQ